MYFLMFESVSLNKQGIISYILPHTIFENRLDVIRRLSVKWAFSARQCYILLKQVDPLTVTTKDLV